MSDPKKRKIETYCEEPRKLLKIETDIEQLSNVDDFVKNSSAIIIVDCVIAETKSYIEELMNVDTPLIESNVATSTNYAIEEESQTATIIDCATTTAKIDNEKQSYVDASLKERQVTTTSTGCAIAKKDIEEPKKVTTTTACFIAKTDIEESKNADAPLKESQVATIIDSATPKTEISIVEQTNVDATLKESQTIKIMEVDAPLIESQVATVINCATPKTKVDIEKESNVDGPLKENEMTSMNCSVAKTESYIEEPMNIDAPSKESRVTTSTDCAIAKTAIEELKRADALLKKSQVATIIDSATPKTEINIEGQTNVDATLKESRMTTSVEVDSPLIEVATTINCDVHKTEIDIEAQSNVDALSKEFHLTKSMGCAIAKSESNIGEPKNVDVLLKKSEWTTSIDCDISKTESDIQKQKHSKVDAPLKKIEATTSIDCATAKAESAIEETKKVDTSMEEIKAKADFRDETSIACSVKLDAATKPPNEPIPEKNNVYLMPPNCCDSRVNYQTKLDSLIKVSDQDNKTKTYDELCEVLSRHTGVYEGQIILYFGGTCFIFLLCFPVSSLNFPHFFAVFLLLYFLFRWGGRLDSLFITSQSNEMLGKIYSKAKDEMGSQEAFKFIKNNSVSKLFESDTASSASSISASNVYKNISSDLVKIIRNEIIEENITVLWDDIAGLEFTKSTIQESVVWPSLRPDIFTGLRKVTKSILLFGPPGTGKTSIGKCIASQTKSTFFNISGSTLTSKWLGESEKLVRALFKVAAAHQPSVIFFDEVDSLLSQRSASSNDAMRRIKTEFMVQLDGIVTNDRVLFIGATNRPQDLDEAVRRRFSKRLYIPLPDASARKQMLNILLKSEKSNMSDTELDEIVTKTNEFSGADIKHLCEDAAMQPLRSISVDQMNTVEVKDIRPLEYSDFTSALVRIRPSVSSKDLSALIEYDRMYGSSNGRAEECDDR